MHSHIFSLLLATVSAEVILLSVPYDEQSDLVDLHLLAFVPMTGGAYPYGTALRYVLTIALRDIGQAGLLDGYRLVVHLEDSQVTQFLI